MFFFCCCCWWQDLATWDKLSLLPKTLRYTKLYQRLSTRLSVYLRRALLSTPFMNGRKGSNKGGFMRCGLCKAFAITAHTWWGESVPGCKGAYGSARRQTFRWKKNFTPLRSNKRSTYELKQKSKQLSNECLWKCTKIKTPKSHLHCMGLPKWLEEAGTAHTRLDLCKINKFILLNSLQMAVRQVSLGTTGRGFNYCLPLRYWLSNKQIPKT